MDVIKKTIKFKNPTHAEVLLLALLDIAYSEVLARPEPRFVLVGQEHNIKPVRTLTLLRTLSNEESPDTIYIQPEADSNPNSVLSVTDFSSEAVIDICTHLLFEPHMYELIKTATRSPRDIHHGKREYLKSIYKMSQVEPSMFENEEDYEYQFFVKKIRPSVISRQNKRNNGLDAIPKKITRTVTLCMRVNKDTGDYSIGHAICNHHYDQPTDIGYTIAQNRSRLVTSSLTNQKLSEMGQVCFKPILLSEEGRQDVMSSLMEDMENNFSKYVAAYRNV